MIDFDKEEFLARLDIRIAVISSILAYHEKYLLSDLPRKDFRKAEQEIDKMNLRFNEMVKENDQKIQEYFTEIKEKIAKESQNG